VAKGTKLSKKILLAARMALNSRCSRSGFVEDRSCRQDKRIPTPSIALNRIPQREVPNRREKFFACVFALLFCLGTPLIAQGSSGVIGGSGTDRLGTPATVFTAIPEFSPHCRDCDRTLSRPESGFYLFPIEYLGIFRG
jgi:hypothetical protein